MSVEARANDWLLEHRHNHTSQFGEDGVLAKVLEVIGASDNGWCVEFGAYDGIFCSNTHTLIKDHGYKAVLIEVNPRRLVKLRENYRGHEGISILDKFVAFEGENSLDNLLAQTPIPQDFDLLSVDVDGNDYHIWKSVEQYRPKVVIIEFNPTIPLELEVVQPKEIYHDCGSSLSALYRLGKEKGYELVATTDANAIFVDRPYFEAFGIADNRPRELWQEFVPRYLMSVYQKFDGTLVIGGYDHLHWHRMKIKPSKIQVLPRFLRFYPGGDSKLLRLIKQVYYRVLRPDLPRDHL